MKEPIKQNRQGKDATPYCIVYGLFSLKELLKK
jgi:hypothetical protein